MKPNLPDNRLSLVVPAYNESQVLNDFYARVTTTLTAHSYDYEIVFVDDGSTDTTRELISHFSEKDDRVRGVFLSRNFGKEVALTAGIDHAKGNAIIVIDADLQDPPELIPDLVNKWQEGYQVVNARRISRDGESWAKKTSAYLFYRLMGYFSDVKIPLDTGDFRLLDRSAALELAKLREHNRYMKGLFSWVGGKQTSIDFHRDHRAAGDTKWSYWRLWNLAIEGITSFSTLPLKLASYFGFMIACFAFIYGSYFVIRTMLFGNPVPGYPSLIVIILFIGGIQLLSVGIIGEYLARIFNETKNRPLYIVQEQRSTSLEENTHLTILEELHEKR